MCLCVNKKTGRNKKKIETFPLKDLKGINDAQRVLTTRSQNNASVWQREKIKKGTLKKGTLTVIESHD